MDKRNHKSDIITIVSIAIVCLVLKFSCFFVWTRIEYPKDLPLTVLSCVYYIALGTLCFFSGKMNISSIVVASALGFEILLQLFVILFGGPDILALPYLLISTAGYALIELIHAFENVGQTISDWYYFAAFAAGQLVFMGIILLGRTFWAKNKPQLQ